jgi:hypothetical protein
MAATKNKEESLTAKRPERIKRARLNKTSPKKDQECAGALHKVKDVSQRLEVAQEEVKTVNNQCVELKGRGLIESPNGQHVESSFSPLVNSRLHDS